MTEGAERNGTVDVSVLTPVLNEEAHIRETVAAMQAQRFEGEVEFLFMDGSSEDATKTILEELARSDTRIRVLDNPARGIPQGLNVGLPELAARYVPRDSIPGLARQYARYGFYRAKTARRHPESMRRSLWLPPALVATGLTAVLAPRPLRSAACAGLLLYAATLVAASARAAEGDLADR